MAETLTLKKNRSSRLKRMLRLVVGTSEGKKEIHMEKEKQIFGRQLFAAPYRENVTQSELWSFDPAEFLLS